jgi:hypothetical protein
LFFAVIFSYIKAFKIWIFQILFNFVVSRYKTGKLLWSQDCEYFLTSHWIVRLSRVINTWTDIFCQISCIWLGEFKQHGCRWFKTTIMIALSFYAFLLFLSLFCFITYVLNFTSTCSNDMPPHLWNIWLICDYLYEHMTVKQLWTHLIHVWSMNEGYSAGNVSSQTFQEAIDCDLISFYIQWTKPVTS